MLKVPFRLDKQVREQVFVKERQKFPAVPIRAYTTETAFLGAVGVNVWLDRNIFIRGIHDFFLIVFYSFSQIQIWLYSLLFILLCYFLLSPSHYLLPLLFLSHLSFVNSMARRKGYHKTKNQQ
jgi:hypothetical protein